MQKINLSNNNPFEERKKAFLQTKLAEKLAEKYKSKPYEEENKSTYEAALYAAYAFQLASIVTASTFVFASIHQKTATLPYSIALSVVLALAVLVLIEYLQATHAPKFFEQLFFRGFNGAVARRLSFLIFLSGFSLFCSYSGGFDFAEKVAEQKPQYVAPTLENIAEIENRYKAQIADAKAAAKEYKERRLYRGKLSISDGNKWRKLLAVATDKEAEMNDVIHKTTSRNNLTLVKSKDEYKQTLADYQSEISSNGGGLSSFAIIAQVGFFLCIWYRERFEYQTAIQYAEPTDDNAPEPNDPSGKPHGKKRIINNLTESDLETLFEQLNGSKDPQQNRAKPNAKMRVLRNAENPQSYLTNSGKAEKQTIYKDIAVEHFSEQKGKIIMVNLSTVKSNKSAWKSHLKKAKESNRSQNRVNELIAKVEYWQGLENEIYSLAENRKKEIV